MSRSPIFDEYMKIAEAKGLVSLGAEETEEHKKYKSETYPRAGSDDLKTIEALYGVKPDSPLEYERNIAEVAHPKAVVIAPAYDRLNALVENINESNDIICNIARKPTHGNETHHRYAKQELLMELVRIANDMDNRNQESIRKLADACIDDLSKKKV